MKACSSGKRCFETESIAVDSLIQHHIINDYPKGEGPINVYECEECGNWHYTSKGERNKILEDPETKAQIKKEHIANYWGRRLR